jgi:hypothetical protein
LAEFTPYISIETEQGELFIQNGQVFPMTGPPVSDPPQWFWDEVKKMTPEALADVKFKMPSKPAVVEAAVALEDAPIQTPIRKRGRPKKERING